MGNRHDVYRGKDCIKKFCESLREHAMIKIITIYQNRTYIKTQKSAIFAKKHLKIKTDKN